MKNNLKYFKFVYLQRPKTTQKYIDLIRHHFSGKIFILHMIYIILDYLENIILHIMKNQRYKVKILKNRNGNIFKS